MNEEHEKIAELLRRDAQGIGAGGGFDAKLHQDTLRRIRQSGESRRRDAWKFPALASGAAMAAIALGLLFLPRQDPAAPSIGVNPPVASPNPATASLLAYRGALTEGEGPLLAMLDGDALILLPTSSNVFLSND